MNMNDMAKANKIYNRIQELDLRIEELRSFAEKVSKGQPSHFKMTLPFFESKKKPIFDEYGFLLPQGPEVTIQWGAPMPMRGMMFGAPEMIPVKMFEKPQDVISGDLLEGMALKIIQVILEDLTERRSRLMMGLKKLGVNLNENQ